MSHLTTFNLPLLLLVVAAINHRSLLVLAESPFVTGEDANAVLQAAFAQAGIDLGPPISSSDDQQQSSSSTSNGQSYSSSRPTLGERLRSTLRFVRRPSLLLRRHRLFQPHQLFIPILAPPTPLPAHLQLNQQNLLKQQSQLKPQQSQQHSIHQLIQLQQQQPSDRKSSNGIAVETLRQSPRSPIPLPRNPFNPIIPIKSSSKNSGKSFKIVSSSQSTISVPAKSSSKAKEIWIPTNHKSVGAATMNGFKPIPTGYSNYAISPSGVSTDSLNSSSSSISPSLLETNEWKQITSPLTSLPPTVDASKSSMNTSKNTTITNSKIIATSDSGSEFRKVNQVESNEVDRSVAESSLNELTKFASLPLTPGEILAEVSKVIAASANVSPITRPSVKGKSECTNKNLGWCEYSPESYPE